MCGVCGCSDTLDHHHHHEVNIETRILAENEKYADANRKRFADAGLIAINLMSSPGSGKTSLLSATQMAIGQQQPFSILTGDQQTDMDAQALKASGAHALQINTGQSCHLDAHILGHALEGLTLQRGEILFIENIGNLVCPALFDLGEQRRIVLLSVTEGDNKPLKYPDMFRKADLLLITKTDLLPYVDFDVEQCLDYARRIQPKVKAIALSSKTGEGMDEWFKWLDNVKTAQ